jgi:hypothetical protein
MSLETLKLQMTAHLGFRYSWMMIDFEADVEEIAKKASVRTQYAPEKVRAFIKEVPIADAVWRVWDQAADEIALGIAMEHVKREVR